MTERIRTAEQAPSDGSVYERPFKQTPHTPDCFLAAQGRQEYYVPPSRYHSSCWAIKGIRRRLAEAERGAVS